MYGLKVIVTYDTREHNNAYTGKQVATIVEVFHNARNDFIKLSYLAAGSKFAAECEQLAHAHHFLKLI